MISTQSEETVSRLHITLLGSPHLTRDGQPVTVRRRKALALLAYLVVTGKRHSRDVLATLLWPETSQRKARGNLRRALSDLNRDIGEGCLLLDGDSVALADDEIISSDISQFRAHVAACGQHDHATGDQCADCLAHLTAAVELYQADLLTGFILRGAPEFDDWQYFEAEGLRRALASALERLVNGHRTLGDSERAIPYARRLQALDPLHEPAQQLLMRAYSAAGHRDAALRQYELFVDLMDEELGQPPDVETTELYATIKAGRPLAPVVQTEPARAEIDASAVPIVAEPRHLLPAQVSPFVGREDELAEICACLRDSAHRAVTLVGPGGIGKTRLSLAAAEAVKDQFVDGVHFVPLAPLQTADNIISEVIDSLDVHFYGQDDPMTQLLNYLASKELLLIMDNFEHLLTGADAVSEILRAAPGVKVLSSSRERLNLSGETIYVVGGMHYPGLMAGRVAAVDNHVGYSAVKLLVQQARLVRPGLTVDDDFLADAVRICRLVQGMPLAIVLAAGWLEMLSLAEIVDEIASSLDFLETEMRDVPDRQRSMRTVFDHSWARLSAAEQAIFMKLAVFRGDFARAAATVVANANLRALRGLVNKSFVVFNQRDRFEVHELLRQYGEEMLAASGEETATRQRHSVYYLDFTHRCEADLRGPGQVDALRVIRADFENVRAAWNWGLNAGNYAAIGDAVEALHLYFDMYGLYIPGAELLGAALLKVDLNAGEEANRVAAKVRARRYFMQSITDDVGPAWEADLDACLRIATSARDEFEVGICTTVMGACFFTVKQELSETLVIFEQAMQTFREIDDRFYQARVLNWMAMVHRFLSNPAENERMFRKELVLAREIGDMSGITSALYNLAEVAMIAGRYDETRANCQEAMSLGRGMTLLFCQCLLSLDYLLCGEMNDARHALRSAEALSATSQSVDLLMLICAMSSALAALDEENEQAERHGRKALALPVSDPLYVAVANWGLAIAQCNRGEFADARSALTTAFDAAIGLDSGALRCWLLPVAAVISDHEGRSELAYGLLAQAATHPLSPTGWHARWRLLSALQTKIVNGAAINAPTDSRTDHVACELDTLVSTWLDADSD